MTLPHQPAAIIMLGGTQATPQAHLMARAWQAAAQDLIAHLHEAGVGQIIVSAPEVGWVAQRGPHITLLPDEAGTAFHFGSRLAQIMAGIAADPVCYFGGASLPLATPALLADLLRRAQAPRTVITNNLHSSDWAILTTPHEALATIATLPRDNALAWALREGAGWAVQSIPAAQYTLHFDLDTPTDLALLALHPDLSPRLREVCRALPLGGIPIRPVMAVMRTEGKTLGLIGRLAPGAWEAVNRACRVWTRVIAEERGMVASERAARGQVRSVLVPWIAARGLAGFFADLGELCDAALIDSRVLFAAWGIRPSDSDRFAADLGRADLVQDPWLREFTAAAAAAPIPVVCGGHSLLSGGLRLITRLIETPTTGPDDGT